MKRPNCKKIIVTLVLLAALTIAPAYASDLGGWNEVNGSYGTQAIKTGASTMSTLSTPSHTGKSETKTISGTTNKRAHGWTTWTGVYHYTRAQMKRYGAVATDSGRQWGTSGTEAISPWLAFDGESQGTAYTFYGN